MLTAIDRNFGQRFREACERDFPGLVDEVRIFGSRARGEAHEESDLDLFVCMRPEDRATQVALMDLAWDVAYELELPYSVSAHVMSRAHFDRIVGLETLFAANILTEGIPV